jgi:sulfonate transport system substrate-binding protein
MPEPAFQQGNVDAWVIWDPFYAAAQAQKDVRVVKDSKGLAANRDFYLANKSFAQPNVKIIEAIREETQAVATWADANPAEVVKILAPILNVDVSILDVVTRRRVMDLNRSKLIWLPSNRKLPILFLNLA